MPGRACTLWALLSVNRNIWWKEQVGIRSQLLSFSFFTLHIHDARRGIWNRWKKTPCKNVWGSDDEGNFRLEAALLSALFPPLSCLSTEPSEGEKAFKLGGGQWSCDLDQIASRLTSGFSNAGYNWESVVQGGGSAVPLTQRGYLWQRRHAGGVFECLVSVSETESREWKR